MDELVHKGHRQRMRRKFFEFGAKVFDTYELLEMLLYHTVPVKDTNPLAKKLLARFGSLDAVFLAEKEELMEVEGIGRKTADMIKTVGEALDFFATELSEEEKVNYFENYDRLGEYIIDYFGGREDYVQIVLLFDNNMKLLGLEELYNYDYSSGAVQSNKFLNAALKCRATVMVIAHNHPHGPLCPSEGDRATNISVQTALHNIGVLLAEHYIVCGTRYVGFMNHFENAFAQKPQIQKFLKSKRDSHNV